MVLIDGTGEMELVVCLVQVVIDDDEVRGSGLIKREKQNREEVRAMGRRREWIKGRWLTLA